MAKDKQINKRTHSGAYLYSPRSIQAQHVPSPASSPKLTPFPVVLPSQIAPSCQSPKPEIQQTAQVPIPHINSVLIHLIRLQFLYYLSFLSLLTIPIAQYLTVISWYLGSSHFYCLLSFHRPHLLLISSPAPTQPTIPSQQLSILTWIPENLTPTLIFEDKTHDLG